MPNWIAVACKEHVQKGRISGNKQNWGYQLRFGLIAISEHDMQLIAKAIQIKNNN
ncbi:hypothetical protein [Legionella londiniensis]|uniref:Uncharacterized protein n=1 Tax=Legionella londiniensis TaxID=45068 RepID=A0A0W0VSB6_9GAMM|nr:hypothetical protein [Legionella londiniensis]KTD22845.1 hypothetical protein Llon_0378 [Legionella londiniensis]STX92718.1 Uncharacterised protein [Legionella londiniensis]